MYESPRRRQGQSIADARAQLVPVDAHVGGPADYLARLVRAGHEAHLDLGRKEFLEKLHLYATEERLLYYALEQLRRYGGQAPGIDGMTYSDIPENSRWEHVRGIRDRVREEGFQADPLRLQRISKAPKPGHRTLELPTIRDRILGKAIALALSAYLDHRFIYGSFGFRPKRGRERALGHALALAERENRWCWVAADIRDAFPSVPRIRLETVLNKYVQNELLIELTMELVSKGQKGVPQGQPLTPLLLNLYLHHVLDSWWSRQNTPLVRVADDLLLLCRDRVEAEVSLQTLHDRLRPHGMILKNSQSEVIIHFPCLANALMKCQSG